MTVTAAPGSRTSASNANPPEGSASLASPTGVSGESRNARATPPVTPPTAMTKVEVMPAATSWRRETPRALSVPLGSASMAPWRASACPTTTIPASAASPARIHHPTTWGPIEEPIAPAAVSMSATDPAPSARAWAWNRGRPAGPWRSRTR